MDLWRRWRADLGRPEAPTRREEFVFLTVTAVVIPLAAQWSDPGNAVEVALLAVASVAFVVRGLWSSMPSLLFAALVIGPVAGAIAPAGHLEVAFFMGVVMVLFTSWHLGSLTHSIGIVAATAVLPVLVSLRFESQPINWCRGRRPLCSRSCWVGTYAASGC